MFSGLHNKAPQIPRLQAGICFLAVVNASSLKSSGQHSWLLPGVLRGESIPRLSLSYQLTPASLALQTPPSRLHPHIPFFSGSLWFLSDSYKDTLIEFRIHSKSVCLHLVVVQSLSHVRLFATPWTACSVPGFPVLHQLLEFAETHVH